MMRESREYYQSGDSVMVGAYRDLKTGQLVRIRVDGGVLPGPVEGVTNYEWISGDPEWNEEQPARPNTHGRETSK